MLESQMHDIGFDVTNIYDIGF